MAKRGEPGEHYKDEIVNRGPGVVPEGYEGGMAHGLLDKASAADRAARATYQALSSRTSSELEAGLQANGGKPYFTQDGDLVTRLPNGKPIKLEIAEEEREIGPPPVFPRSAEVGEELKRLTREITTTLGIGEEELPVDLSQFE